VGQESKKNLADPLLRISSSKTQMRKNLFQAPWGSGRIDIQLVKEGKGKD
jgi:hypothetical protein